MAKPQRNLFYSDRFLTPDERCARSPETGIRHRFGGVSIHRDGVPVGFVRTDVRCPDCGDLVGFVHRRTRRCLKCCTQTKTPRARRKKQSGGSGKHAQPVASDREIAKRIRVAQRLRREVDEAEPNASLLSHPDLETELPRGERRKRGNGGSE